ncbi:MAG: hypothetical protein JWM53_6542 [bacterium]|nr:hypothetical protein [bacterium]
MTVTIATPDRKTVAALSKKAVEPARITRCLERASASFAGARVIDAQCVALLFDPHAHTFTVCGELQLPAEVDWKTLAQVARALALELRRDGFAVD